MDFEYPWSFASRRSTVHARNGMVATSHPIAAQAGLDVLRDGGNAADAAVATAAVLNVVEPHMTGIGGDAFALAQFDGAYDALNASGPAPGGADRETYRGETDATDDDGEPEMPASGGLPVTVPGALAGWQALLDRHGTLDLADALAPAADYARDGVPVPQFVAKQWRENADRLTAAGRRTFLPRDEPPAVGDTFANPAFAETLDRIRTDGPGVLYGGALGEAVVETVQAYGGTLALSDLAAYEPEWTEPIATEYGGFEVLEHPPNCQGAIALEALNVARELDLPPDARNPDRIHNLVEAVKLAFADGYATVADPALADVPLDRMLSREYAARRATEIQRTAGTYDARASPSADTVYLAVVDGDGNAVSFINSLYMAFGSGLVVEGFALQNRGHAFSLDPDHPNRLQPGKRPFHTLIPAMLREDGDFRAAWGVMGGSMQPQGHLQVAANLADGLDPQAALDAPRFRWLADKRIALETTRLPAETVSSLRDRGHRIVAEDEFFDAGGHWGGGQVVYRTPDGVLVGGSDPRRDGQAAGY